MLGWIAVSFASGFFLDVFWTGCVRAVGQHRPLAAASLSVATFLMTLPPTAAIVDHNMWAILAYCGGGFLGTYVGTLRT